MTTIVPVPAAPAFEPRHDTASPERLIAGTPSFKTWAIDSALAEATPWGKVRTGVWEATPGETRSIKGSSLEFCHLLAGRVEITSDTGESWTFAAGDSFLMKPGFTGRWHTLETVRKIYVFVEC